VTRSFSVAVIEAVSRPRRTGEEPNHANRLASSLQSVHWTIIRYENWDEDVLQCTILRASTRLVNIMNITSYEAHNPIVWQKTLVLSSGSDDGRVERKNDFHNCWLIVCTTDSINGNPFLKLLLLSNVPLAIAWSVVLRTLGVAMGQLVCPRLSVSGFDCSDPATAHDPLHVN
jgi:hypothetical protein